MARRHRPQIADRGQRPQGQEHLRVSKHGISKDTGRRHRNTYSHHGVHCFPLYAGGRISMAKRPFFSVSGPAKRRGDVVPRLPSRPYSLGVHARELAPISSSRISKPSCGSFANLVGRMYQPRVYFGLQLVAGFRHGVPLGARASTLSPFLEVRYVAECYPSRPSLRPAPTGT
jgi:hypothetical protein